MNLINILIEEVWNHKGESQKLVILENVQLNKARTAVYDWISANRPELQLATGILDHGYHAIATAETN
jgi:hypothetical protein